MTGPLSGLEIYAPAFSLDFGLSGPKIPMECVAGVVIDEDLDAPASFEISLNDSLDRGTQRFRLLDDPLLVPGAGMKISFGYAHSPERGIARGRISGITPGFLGSGAPSLGLRAFDLSHGLMKTRGRSGYEDTAYFMIAAEIALANGLDPSGVEPSLAFHPRVERHTNENDYDFLKRLAGEAGLEFFVRDKSLHFRKPRDTGEGDIRFAYGENIISFSPRLSASHAVAAVQVNYWDPAAKKPSSETVSFSDIKSGVGLEGFGRLVALSGGEPVLKVEGRAVRSAGDARALAEAELRKRNSGFIEGSLRCAGDPRLRPGMMVSVERVGRLFSGTYYIKKAVHTLGGEGYATALELRRCVF